MTRLDLAPGVTLVCADCLDVLPALAAEFGPFGATITDPPYEAHMHRAKAGGGREIRTDGHASPAPVAFASIEAQRAPAAAAIVAATRGWALAFCTPEGVAPWRDAFEAAGARYKRACVWVKPDAAPQFNGQGPAMGAEMFTAVWCGPGVSRWNGGGRRNVWTCPTRGPERCTSHPTEKPVPLMAALVADFTAPGALVCDPFAGTGTTGVAAVRLGRRFLGIERDREWFDVAVARLEAELAAPRLALPEPVRAKQEAML